MERAQNLIRFPEIPSISLPQLPNQREIVEFCLRAGFNNPLVQKVGDFIVENGRLGDLRDRLIPLFEASEGVRDRIAEIATKFGIIPESQPELRTPRRIPNPIDGITFEEDFKSEHFNESTSDLPAQLNVLLCSPTRHRDDGKVNRFKTAFLPQGANPIIEAATPAKIDGVPVKVADYDDKAGKGISIPEIVKYALKHPDHKTVVCLTSIQTNQFPRALDIALQLKAIALKLGLDLVILMGGPHIINHEESVAKLIELGIIPVQGEIEEGRFPNILADALHNKLQPQYKFSLVKNISDIPLPKPTRIEGYASAMATFQASRGCPHKCRFCSSVKIEGRKMRYKTVEETEIFYRTAIEEGIKTLFITDNNFLRNKNCRSILEMMARVRRETGAGINIMFQSDLKVVKNGEIDTEFMDLCKEAGVFMIFFGQESFDPKVLTEQMDKGQNIVHIARHYGKATEDVTEKDVFNYTKMVIEQWQKRGIAVNYTCIIGLKGDKPGCGKQMAKQAKKLGVTISTFFIYTLLPGSEDYDDYVISPQAAENRKKAGMRLVDINFNNADSTHPNVVFEDGLTADQQIKEYLNAMREFYVVSRIKKDWNPSVLAYYLLHCLAAALGEHPMSIGIWRQENVERELPASRRMELENYIRSRVHQYDGPPLTREPEVPKECFFSPPLRDNTLHNTQ